MRKPVSFILAIILLMTCSGCFFGGGDRGGGGHDEHGEEHGEHGEQH